MGKSALDMKYAFDRLYKRYNHRRFIQSDPLQFVYRYSKPADMEITAFLASALAYGRVRHIERSLNLLLQHMGESPFAFVLHFDRQKRLRFNDFRHRFTSGPDISDLIALLCIVLRRYGSLEKCFISGYHPSQRNIVPALSKFCDRLLNIHAGGCLDGQISRGLKFLLAGPAGGSASKRLNLFLRWMVRNDNVDTGLWKSIEPARLIVPVDVHMGRLCKILDLYSQKTLSLSAAMSITESFARIEPDDPVKYDFALSRIGIVEHCDGRYRPECESCHLYQFCRQCKMESRVFSKTG